MKQYEMLLAEIERRKKVLALLGEGCIVGQRNAAEYKLLCELEEFAKGLTSEVTSDVTSEVTSEISEDVWESSKRYALLQVLASTDVEMTEQAYLSMKLFSGFEIAVAHKDGADWQRQQIINKAAEWLEENICEYLDGEDIEYSASMTYNITILQNERLVNEFKKAMEE